VANVVIVADPVDAGAVAVASATAARHPALRVTVVSPAALSHAGWTHTVDGAGTAATTVELDGGRRLSDRDVAAVLVRSETTPVPRFAGSAPVDRDYAAAEIRALVISWLRSLGPRVVNGVDGMGLSGPSWTPQRWLIEAARAGLPVGSCVRSTSARIVPGWRGSPYDARRPYVSGGATSDENTEVAVVAGDVALGQDGLDPAPFLALAAAAHCRVLEVELTGSPPSRHVTAVRPVPLLTLDDGRVVGAVADLVARLALAAVGGLE
jgi:hypothetical protein